MVCAIDVLSKYNNRTIAVLGDMLELGEYSKDMHTGIGEVAKREAFTLDSNISQKISE